MSDGGSTIALTNDTNDAVGDAQEGCTMSDSKCKPKYLCNSACKPLIVTESDPQPILLLDQKIAHRRPRLLHEPNVHFKVLLPSDGIGVAFSPCACKRNDALIHPHVLALRDVRPLLVNTKTVETFASRIGVMEPIPRVGSDSFVAWSNTLTNIVTILGLFFNRDEGIE